MVHHLAAGLTLHVIDPYEHNTTPLAEAHALDFVRALCAVQVPQAPHTMALFGQLCSSITLDSWVSEAWVRLAHLPSPQRQQ